LTRLLNEHQIPLPKGSDTGAEVAADYLYGSNIAPLTRKPPSADASDEAVLESARKGDLSFFVAVLNAIRRNVPPVTTKKIIRSCCMTLRPGDVPGSLDAKEMVLAALFFLSSKLETKSKNLQDLPLIQPAQELGDLEKRAYMKAWEWRIEDITENVLALEQIFFATPSKWRWLSREKFCPRLTEKEEASFFMKGSIPASAAAKRVKGETTRKRKAAPAPTTLASATSPPEAEANSIPVVEAAVIAEPDSLPSAAD